jgi:hypothetical protein
MPKHRTMRSTTLLLLFHLSIGTALAQAPEVLHHWWRTDDNVNALAMDEANNRVIIGGAFRYVGPPQNYLSFMDATTGAPAPGIAHPNRPVRCAIPDGQGGWYIGGEFTEVGGISRQRLAHLNAAGQVTSWNAIASSTVTHLSLDGNVLYVGGNFEQLNLSARDGLGALNATTGALLAWSPVISGGSATLTSLLAHSGRVYLAGFFTSVNGEPRDKLAAVEGTSGAVLPWAPAIAGWAGCLEALGDTVLVGGFFSQIGGAPRQNLAALDGITGVPTDWAPAVNGSTNDMLIDNGTAYLAGAFTQVGGQPRASFAQVDLVTGAPTNWAPRTTAGGSGHSLAMSGNTIYLGGNFQRIDGQDRFHLAAVDALTGTLTPWAPGANKQVAHVGFYGEQVFAAGSFTSTGGVPRAGLAALDLTTGAATDWAPYTPLYSNVFALALRNGIVHVGGVFDSLAYAPRQNIGAVDGSTGAATAWDPQANNVVQLLAEHDQLIFAGGAFDSIGGQEQPHIAALDPITGASTGWAPEVNDDVRSIAFVGDTAFIGGDFTTVNGQTHLRLAALHLSSSDTWAWDAGLPTGNTSVQDLLVRDEVLYLAGIFGSVGGQPRGGLAAVQRQSGTLTDWAPSASGQGWCLLLTNGAIIAGGDVVPFETQPLSRELIATDPGSGLLNNWSMNFGGRVAVIAGSAQVTCVAGMSTNLPINDEPVQYFAALGLPISTGVAAGTTAAPGRLGLGPNPTAGMVRVSSTLPGGAELRVFNAQGALVLRTPFAHTLDLAALPAGAYTVVLADRSGAPLERALVVKE